MEAEELNVLYDYDYDYKDRKISIRRDEKLKLLQRTNQHWWKVVRPGVNKAFFVPAQYVEVKRKSPQPTTAMGTSSQTKKVGNDENGKRLELVNNSPSSSISSSYSPETDIKGKKNSTMAGSTITTTVTTPSNSSARMKRGDSTRASKKATRLKNWSASLEELSKQIKFPGINSGDCAESVMNLSCCSTPSSVAPSGLPMPPPPTMTPSPAAGDQLEKKCKPVPLPRKSVSESCSGEGSGHLTPMTPKPVPKVRTSKWVTDGGSKSSGGSSEVLTATSSEELLLSHDQDPQVNDDDEHDQSQSDGNTLVSPGDHYYKKESVLVTRNRFESPPDPVDGRSSSRMKPKELRRSSPVQLVKQSSDSPRKPSRDEIPIRPLSENWAEYMTAEKRFYYYNSQTGATSWKPPRIPSSSTLQQNNHRRGGSGGSGGGDNLSSLENSHSSLILDSSEVSENNNHFSILREEEDCSNKMGMATPSPRPDRRNEYHKDSMTPSGLLPVPVGWSYVYDGTLGQGYYVNDSNGARWLSSQDPEGKIYYYEENSTKSSWFLPVPGISFIDSSTPKSTTSDSLERSREVSPRGVTMPDVITTLPSPQMGSPSSIKKRHSVGDATDRFKARSMLILPESRKLENTKVGSLPRSHQRSIWNSSKDEETWIKVIREGLLSRTKITENGKKVRKNWAHSYVVLTEEHLSLFKDEKSFGSKKSELEIELSGSTVDWSVDKTSRKHVFQLNTSTDLQILFQAEETETARVWIEDIQEVIKRQPVRELLRLRSTSPDPYMGNVVVGEKKSSRLGRAKSTKLKITESVENLTSEEKNKIRAQLKKFFNRRPARESLVKKGIYKDEAVFGCHLEKLCAREGKQVPNFVQEAIAAIESKDENMKTDGIYRASGNLSQVQKIRLQVDQNNLSCLYQEEDVHVLAGALKLFFREMREPLIPSDLFTEALTATNTQSKKEKISKFRELIGKLGKPNRATLNALLKHLLKVSEYSEFNRMLIPNLAIVFGPTLMWPATESQNMALDLMQQNFVIEALLLDFELIFEKR